VPVSVSEWVYFQRLQSPVALWQCPRFVHDFSARPIIDWLILIVGYCWCYCCRRFLLITSGAAHRTVCTVRLHWKGPRGRSSCSPARCRSTSSHCRPPDNCCTSPPISKSVDSTKHACVSDSLQPSWLWRCIVYRAVSGQAAAQWIISAAAVWWCKLADLAERVWQRCQALKQ